MLRITLATLFFLFYLAVSAQSDDSIMVRKIADEILVNGKAYEQLRILCKTVGGRLAGSAQMLQAEQWGVEALKVSGADQVWLQECMVPRWERGGKETVYYIHEGRKVMMDALALGNSVGTGREGITAPVLMVNSFEELDQRKEEVKGKVVFYNYKFNPRMVKTFQAYGEAARYRSQGAGKASRYGAVAVIVRSMSHSTDNHPHTGGMGYDSAYPKIPAVAVGLQDADRLASMLEKNSRSMVPVHIQTNCQMLEEVKGHNVIGELTGSEFPHEYITVGGHLDSWDPAEGAHDDGAGCVHSIEVLRCLKAIGYKPKRTVRVVLFANEENGLRGGAKYADEAKQKGEKHFFALESDAGGFTPRSFGFSMKKEQLEKVQQWVDLFKPYGVFELTAGGGGADIGPLSRMLGTPVAGFSPDSQRYFDLHHARNDVFENVNKRELELGAVNMAALIYLIDKHGL